jgi:hypothetical protein
MLDDRTRPQDRDATESGFAPSAIDRHTAIMCRPATAHIRVSTHFWNEIRGSGE